MLEGEDVDLEHKRHKIAEVFCDEDDSHWETALQALGGG